MPDSIKNIKAKNKLGLIFFPAFDWAISPTHPEREERLLYTRDQVFEEGLMDIDGIKEFNPGIAEEKDVQKVHICVPEVKKVTTPSHLISAGGAIKAAGLVLNKEVDKAFAIVRPPGHHAFRVVHGARGFCNINNEAIMVEAIRSKYPDLKIAFVDTDAHHADGTQEIFYHDPHVLHISLHQNGRTLFPGSGFTNEVGGPGAYARTLNIPLPPYTTDEGLHYVLDNLVLPVLEDFKPDLIINAAGQDNHYSDPLTNMKISARGYAELNARLNPDIAILQGGYSIESALPYINVGLILAMAGLDYSNVREPDFDSRNLTQDPVITDNIKNTVAVLREIWENRNNQAPVPDTGEFTIKNNFYEREKHIFYDTDGINELQRERVKACPDCPGYIIIDSRAEKGFRNTRIKAISIPLKACKNCHEEAHLKFEEAKKEAGNKYDYLYLQDVKGEEFVTYPSP
ncbi:histone deacetylase family protein [Halothermothrix orenii]|nr:histone deacetylase [Halothermothrix orenii]